jgi:DNA polymerase III epsilon subunit-like protein
MKLIKDILVFALETTGNDIDKDHIIQLSAVLLDKDNLLEKQSFNSYVKVSFLDGTIASHATQLGIDFEVLRKSAKITEVLRDFIKTIGYDPLLTTHSVQNYLFLRQAFKKNLVPFKYDNHILDVWSLGYIYILHYGIKKIPTLTTLSNHFNLKIKNQNNALEKARLTAEVLRKIING